MLRARWFLSVIIVVIVIIVVVAAAADVVAVNFARTLYIHMAFKCDWNEAHFFHREHFRSVEIIFPLV